MPEVLSFEQGAAFPLQGMTAHYLIHEFRKPKPGDIVLIHAAAGGMGLLLVQWSRHLGARVIGTVSTEEKAKAARQASATDPLSTPGRTSLRKPSVLRAAMALISSSMALERPHSRETLKLPLSVATS